MREQIASLQNQNQTRMIQLDKLNKRIERRNDTINRLKRQIPSQEIDLSRGTPQFLPLTNALSVQSTTSSNEHINNQQHMPTTTGPGNSNNFNPPNPSNVSSVSSQSSSNAFFAAQTRTCLCENENECFCGFGNNYNPNIINNNTVNTMNTNPATMMTPQMQSVLDRQHKRYENKHYAQIHQNPNQYNVRYHQYSSSRHNNGSGTLCPKHLKCK